MKTHRSSRDYPSSSFNNFKVIYIISLSDITTTSHQHYAYYEPINLILSITLYARIVKDRDILSPQNQRIWWWNARDLQFLLIIIFWNQVSPLFSTWANLMCKIKEIQWTAVWVLGIQDQILEKKTQNRPKNCQKEDFSRPVSSDFFGKNRPHRINLD